MVFVNEMSPEQLALPQSIGCTPTTSDELRAALEASYDHIGSVPADDQCLQAMADASAVGFVTSDATVELYVLRAPPSWRPKSRRSTARTCTQRHLTHRHLPTRSPQRRRRSYVKLHRWNSHPASALR